MVPDLRSVRDPAELAGLLSANAREDASWIDPAAWLADPRNFALRRNDDVVLFAAGDDWPGPLHAHVFCASRGKDALETGRQSLEQAFGYGATEILGETPARFRDAWLYARLLGFRRYGEETRHGERMILSRLTPDHLNNCRGAKIAA